MAPRCNWSSRRRAQQRFSAGTLEFGIAWAAITLAIIIAVLATLFALAATSVALGIAATLTGLPLILFGIIIWFVVRSAVAAGLHPTARRRRTERRNQPGTESEAARRNWIEARTRLLAGWPA